jgi:sulfhydrogenase subunit delta
MDPDNPIKTNPATPEPARPKLAVWKFASCDGCQLSLLDCEDELLAVAEALTIANFAEASRAVVAGPYDLSLVEGSITTAHDAERIKEIRAQSRRLVTIGACATAGGIQALRNYRDVREFASIVYARPEYIDTLATSSAIADHVHVDFQLNGCPIDKRQLLEVLVAFLHGRRPAIAAHPVCVACKQNGTVCVTVAKGIPCLGPVTHAGCGALCPRYDRGCYGCFGPSDNPQTRALAPVLERAQATPDQIARLYSTFHVAAPAWQEAHLLPLGRTAPARGDGHE